MNRFGRAAPLAGRLNRARKLLLAELRGLAGEELRYQPGADLREELLALKTFMRRTFQVLAYNGIDGDYAEFGCYGARTMSLAAGAARLVGHPARFWAFDSFQGLPDSSDPRDCHKGWQPGAMAMTESEFIETCVSNGVPRGSLKTVAGFYASTLRDARPTDHVDRVCFAYIDCDLYTSAVDALGFIRPRLCHGAVVAFDDYYCSGAVEVSGERLAAADIFGRDDRWRLVPYMQYGWSGMSFMVEDRSKSPAPMDAW